MSQDRASTGSQADPAQAANSLPFDESDEGSDSGTRAAFVLSIRKSLNPITAGETLEANPFVRRRIRTRRPNFDPLTREARPLARGWARQVRIYGSGSVRQSNCLVTT